MNNKECTGCGLCAKKCPKKCIKMCLNSEGFYYPVIDKTKCINCNLCKKNCPLKLKLEKNLNARTYALQLKNKKKLNKCASGGAFYSIATTILKKGGVVIGVGRNKDLSIEFKFINKKSDLYKVQNSKYFQCNLTNDIYDKINEIIKNKFVLFSGTPCQVAAVKTFFQNNNNKDNLITLEILCQGVPSYKTIKYFYDYYEKKEKSKLIDHQFRSKNKYVGRDYLSIYEYENGTKKEFVGGNDILTLSFQRFLFLRNSCYNCHFSNENRISYFKCGDIWSFDDKNSKIVLKNGVSFVRCNNDKALKILFETNNCNYIEVDEKEILKTNIPFHTHVKKPFFRHVSYKLIKLKISPKIITILGAWKFYVKKIIERK